MKSLPPVVRMVHRTRGNPLWPLPPDYNELTAAGKSLARANACRQYLLPWGDQSNYEAALHRQALVFVDCLNFFDNYYLMADGSFDPGFYEQWVKGAPIHFRISYEAYRSRALLQVLPRGLTKTTGKKKEILLKMLTKVPHSLVYTTSTHLNSDGFAESLRMQIRHNVRILEDFGQLAPRKGDGSFNNTRFILLNGFKGLFTSIESKQRGQRPLEYVLDDVEADAKNSTDMEAIREELDVRITKVIRPMLQRAGTRFHMMATPISNQHLATRLAADLLGLGDDPAMQDHVSRTWTRVAHPIIDKDGRSIWPNMYPTDDAEKAELGLHPETPTLEDVRRDVGEAAWFSEYLLQPGRAAAGFFKFDREKNGYKVVGRFPAPDEDPKRSDAVLRWTRVDGTVVERPVGEIARSGSTFMTVDTSYGHGPTSDYKVAHVLMRTEEGEFLSLDVYAARVPQPEFIQEILELADRWRCHTVFPEYVVSQREFCDTLKNSVGERLAKSMGFTHLPRVKKLSVHNEPKKSRIEGLALYFEHGLIRLPLDRVYDRECLGYYMLRSQIEGFNPQAKDGGISNDDVLDTLAAAPRTPKSYMENPAAEESEDEIDAMVEAWLRGETHWKGHLIFEQVDFRLLAPLIPEREANLHAQRDGRIDTCA